MSSKAQLSVPLTLLILLLTACSLAPTPGPSSTPSAVPPTQAPPATPDGEFSPVESGQRYFDYADDMAVSFLDVVAFQARVDEESDTLDVLLWMRDIPDMADRGQVTNLFEYAWTIHV
ncbi:MAG TPA: hypothetical protein VK900_16095, partial [Anaerolineales bacterium]|nr:hypothetical protein [Anaerolineales bacterium]